MAFPTGHRSTLSFCESVMLRRALPCQLTLLLGREIHGFSRSGPLLAVPGINRIIRVVVGPPRKAPLRFLHAAGMPLNLTYCLTPNT